MRTPNNKSRNGDPTRYVIKRGLTTLTTIGCLNGFESHVRRYYALGSRDSVEVAVYPYDRHSGVFSEEGDSGSMIVDGCGDFVALLTSGTGTTESTDVTFGTPMHWLWEVIKDKFPDATLHFKGDDLWSKK
uniref:Cytochrome P450 monooxygenase CYP52X1 n=1 Tax=Ganoderma boninense TaxID=34458 RepID=A0A5K1JZV2_9APHY|nr:Cytochrome P450 monooxygenase CYP52X1 [Ganoderma boninense]